MKRGEPIDVLYVQVFFRRGLGGLLLGVLFLCSKKRLSRASKASPFECGFWPHKSSRLPFSLQFFLIALIFLVFDVELIFIFPLLLVILFFRFFSVPVVFLRSFKKKKKRI